MAQSSKELEEFKAILSHYAVNAKAESFRALRDRLQGKEGEALMKEIGCNSNCPLCKWGRADAKPWENHCHIWAFGELLEDCSPGNQRGNAYTQRAARQLLLFIESL